MFKNIGSKIKKLAIVITVLECMISIIYGIVSCIAGKVLFGILVIVIGSVIAWISSFFTYGFGELIDNTSKIAKASKLSKQDNEKQTLSSNVEYEHEDDEEVTLQAEDEYLSFDDVNIPKENECPNCFAKITSKTKNCSNCGYPIK